MDKEQLLALGLTDELADKVMKEFGNMVPQSRLNEITSARDNYKQQLEERDKQLKELSKSVKDNEELSKQIKTLQEQNQANTKEYEEKLAKTKLDNAINLELTKMGVKDNDLVKVKLSHDAIKFENDELVGLEEQVKSLKESHSYLFQEEKPQKPSGVIPGQSGDINTPVEKSWSEIIKSAYSN